MFMMVFFDRVDIQRQARNNGRVDGLDFFGGLFF